jgi:hypothetical protein
MGFQPPQMPEIAACGAVIRGRCVAFAAGARRPDPASALGFAGLGLLEIRVTGVLGAYRRFSRLACGGAKVGTLLFALCAPPPARGSASPSGPSLVRRPPSGDRMRVAVTRERRSRPTRSASVWHDRCSSRPEDGTRCPSSEPRSAEADRVSVARTRTQRVRRNLGEPGCTAGVTVCMVLVEAGDGLLQAGRASTGWARRCQRKPPRWRRRWPPARSTRCCPVSRRATWQTPQRPRRGCRRRARAGRWVWPDGGNDRLRRGRTGRLPALRVVVGGLGGQAGQRAATGAARDATSGDPAPGGPSGPRPARNVAPPRVRGWQPANATGTGCRPPK